MIANIVTVEDLEIFKQTLIEQLFNLLEQRQAAPSRRFLKSHEAMKLLRLSPNTLRGLRKAGTLPFKKVGGIIYYDYQDIRKMLETDPDATPQHHPFNANRPALRKSK